MKGKSLFIKISIGLASFIFFNLNKAYCQEFYDWSEPVSVTDSVSDNVNAYLRLVYDHNSQQYLTMVWETSSDSTTTAIYYQDLFNQDGPQVVISSPGVHYTHPKVIDIGAVDTLFYVFFESDQNGNQDIYYVKYLPEGNFSGPVPFAVSGQDEKNFCSAHESLWNSSSLQRYVVNSFAWTRDGVLVTCDVDDWNGGIPLYTAPYVIDSNNCSGIFMPMTQLLFWIREEANGSFIYYSTRPWDGDWTEPQVYYNESDCQNLSGDKIAGQYLTWTSPVDSVWQMFIGNTYYDYPDIYAVDLEMNEPFDPGICGVILTTEPVRQYIGELYLASPYPETNNYEIFMNDYPYNFGFWNFTNSYTDNRNPDFFLGEDIPWAPGCFYVYLIWESMRNSHWQLFDSKVIMCIGGIDEQAEDQEFIKTYPNPFTENLNISYKLPKAVNVNVKINDLFGRTISELFTGKQLAGDQLIKWDGCDHAGNEVPPGFYIVQLNVENGYYVASVLKSD
jgi:hypothetical protein